MKVHYKELYVLCMTLVKISTDHVTYLIIHFITSYYVPFHITILQVTATLPATPDLATIQRRQNTEHSENNLQMLLNLPQGEPLLKPH